MKIRIVLMLGFWFLCGAAFADERPRVHVVWTETPPEIDGKLDDAVWERAALVGDLTQVVPVQGAKPSQRTEIRILTDHENLYFGFRCYDTDPDQIVRNRMVRDGFLFFDDRVQVVLDPFHDRRNGYSFEINANGARRDVLLEGKAFSIDWDTIWYGASTVDSEGWSAEIKIPYQSINYDPDGETWGINFSRGIRRNNEESRWADPYPQRFVADLGNAGDLEGMAGERTGIGLDVVPALTLRHVNDPGTKSLGGSDGEVDTHVDPSGDIFFKVLPSLTASVTANTNFSETEADDRKVNFSRFALSFPEKRDFFLQDALIFEFAELTDDFTGSPTNGQPFFSRRIGIGQPDPDVDRFVSSDIVVGGKLTGRVNRFKIGLLHTLVEGFEGIDRQQLSVGRLAVNVLDESTMGVIVTHGDPEGRVDNTLVGTDFVYRNSRFRGDKTLTGTAYFQRSFTEGKDDDQSAWAATLAYPNDIVRWSLGYKEIGENFNPALGFVNRPGIRQYDAKYRYRVRRHGYLRTLDAELEGLLVTNRSNEIESGHFRITPTIENEIGGRFDFVYQHTFERPRVNFDVPGVTIRAGSYQFNEGRIKINLSRNRRYSGDLIVAGGEYYDGHQVVVIPEIEFRPSRHLLLKARYSLTRVWIPFQMVGGVPTGGTATTHVLRAEVGVFFNTDVSWITIVQYDNVTNSMGINSRFRWIVEDGREIFVVLNQDFDTTDGIRRGRTEPLIKVAWNLRF